MTRSQCPKSTWRWRRGTILIIGALIMLGLGYGLWQFVKNAVEAAQLLPADQLRQRWLSGIPCRPPCWEGIVPGETSATEAASILGANPFFTEVQVYKSPIPGIDTGFVDFAWRVQQNWIAQRGGGDALFDYTTSEQLIYVIRPTIPATRLSEFIQAFGQPSHIIAYKNTPTDVGGPYTWEVWVLWIPSGFAVSVGSFSELSISKDLNFYKAFYFSPTLDGFERATSVGAANGAKPWQGYGSFGVYAMPTRPAITPEP
jgi:hypothetical protein